MADGDTITPPPGTGADVTEVQPTKKERILKGIGGAVAGATGASSDNLFGAIEKHQQARLNEAKFHQNNIKTTGSALHMIHQGWDPEAQMRFDDPGYKGEGQAALEARYTDWYNSATAAFQKAAGVDKGTKAAVARSKGIVDHIIGLGRQQGSGAGGPAAAGGGTSAQAGLPAPPQFNAQAQGDQSVDASPKAGGGLTPPPGMAAAGAGGGGGGDYATRGMRDLPNVARDMDDQRQVSQYRKKVDIDKAAKIEEEKAKAAAKAVNPSGAIRLASPLSISEARNMAAAGTEFLNANGEPIDVKGFDDTMQLVPVVQGHSVFYLPTSQRERTVTVGLKTYAVPVLEQTNLPQGAGVELGASKTPTVRKTYDPTTGQTTTSTSTPATPGIEGRGGMGPAGAPPSAQPRTSAAPAQKATGAAGAGKSTPGAIPLTSDGHIQQDWNGASPQVIEAANQLIDERDVDKIPTKVRELGASLARKTGWFQGKFNPQQTSQMRNAVEFLDDMAKSPSLKVLDDEGSRLKLIPIISAGSGKPGTFAKIASEVASKRMTPAEADFVRQYNITAQALAGMASFTRGGNKATEAAINRLLTDLPNVMTSRDSKDGRERLNLLLTEAKRILQKGSFQEKDVPTGGGSKPSAPPKGASSTTPSGDVIKWTRDAQGKPIIDKRANASP